METTLKLQSEQRNYTFRQMSILLLIAGASDPWVMAVYLRRLWTYYLGLAHAAQLGILGLDAGHPEIERDPETYVEQAEDVLYVLDEWTQEQVRRIA